MYLFARVAERGRKVIMSSLEQEERSENNYFSLLSPAQKFLIEYVHIHTYAVLCMFGWMSFMLSRPCRSGSFFPAAGDGGGQTLIAQHTR